MLIPLIEKSDFQQSFTILSESVNKDGKKCTRFRAKIQHVGKPNRNRRIYPRKVMERELKKFQSKIEGKRSFGALDHPGSTSDKSMSRICVLWDKVEMHDDGAVFGEATIIETEAGRDLRAILQAGGIPGVSSRGTGSTAPVTLENVTFDEIQEDFDLETFDLVLDESVHDATVRDILESSKTKSPEEEKPMDPKEAIRKMTLEDFQSLDEDLRSKLLSLLGAKEVDAETFKKLTQENEDLKAKNTELEEAVAALDETSLDEAEMFQVSQGQGFLKVVMEAVEKFGLKAQVADLLSEDVTCPGCGESGKLESFVSEDTKSVVESTRSGWWKASNGSKIGVNGRPGKLKNKKANRSDLKPGSPSNLKQDVPPTGSSVHEGEQGNLSESVQSLLAEKKQRTALHALNEAFSVNKTPFDGEIAQDTFQKLMALEESEIPAKAKEIVESARAQAQRVIDAASNMPKPENFRSPIPQNLDESLQDKPGTTENPDSFESGLKAFAGIGK